MENRTILRDEVFSLLLNVGNGFNEVNKKRTAKNSRQSFKVSLARFELATQ